MVCGTDCESSPAKNAPQPFKANSANSDMAHNEAEAERNRAIIPVMGEVTYECVNAK